MSRRHPATGDRVERARLAQACATTDRGRHVTTVTTVSDPSPSPDDAVPGTVHSLVRGLRVIRAFDAGHARLTLSEVARRTDLSRATARRCLLTLVEVGYVGSDGRDFFLRPRVLELGHTYLTSLGLPAIAQPHLEELTARVHESCSVAVLDGTDVVYVARVARQRIMTVSIHVGTRFPAHLTSLGRVLLADLPDRDLDQLLSQVEFERLTPHTVTDEGALRAELDRVRRQGWAVVDQELEVGLRSIAVPLRDRSGRATAALNISAGMARGSVAAVRRELLEPLRESAAGIEKEMAHLPL